MTGRHKIEREHKTYLLVFQLLSMPRAETNGITTYYEEYGAGQPIVVLHGGNSDHQLWAEQLRPLADSYRVIVYDLRGHGQSDSSDHEAYSISLYADDLAHLINELGLTDPTVCGLSVGGMVGYKFAANYPAELSALVTLGAPSPRLFSLKERVIRIELMRIAAPIMGNERVMRALTWTIERMNRNASTVAVDDVKRIRERHSCDSPGISAADRKKMLSGAIEYMGSSVDWEAVDVPVLKLYGENEPFIAEHAEFVEAHLDDCRVREVPGASHNSHVDNPEFIIREIARFLASVATDSELQAVE